MTTLTIKIKEVEFDVEFDYQLEEKVIPGSAALIESINKITHKGTDFMKFFEDDLEEIEVAIWDKLNQTP